MSRRECIQVINNVVGSINECTGEVEYSAYGYLPSTAAGYAFTVLFGISTLLHFGTAIRYRTWSMLWTATACALLETLGWAGRLASSQNMNWIPFFGGFYRSDRNFFIMQICCLIIAPAFLAAAIYIILGYTINHVGAQYSPIKPKTYLWIFVSGDVFSLVIQAVGGGIASGNDNDLERANMGANIMLAGIVFQVVVMLAFFTVFGLFIINLRRGVKAGDAEIEKKPKWLLVGITTSMGFVFIRSVYRVAELHAGWSSDILHNEPLFIALDGAMMVIAVWIVNFAHPGLLLPASSHNVRIKQRPGSPTEKQEKEMRNSNV